MTIGVTEEHTALADAVRRWAADHAPTSVARAAAEDGGKEPAEVWQGLVDRSVLVRNCSSWPRLTGCLRVTVGTPEEDDAFLAALTEVLS